MALQPPSQPDENLIVFAYPNQGSSSMNHHHQQQQQPPLPPPPNPSSSSSASSSYFTSDPQLFASTLPPPHKLTSPHGLHSTTSPPQPRPSSSSSNILFDTSLSNYTHAPVTITPSTAPTNNTAVPTPPASAGSSSFDLKRTDSKPPGSPLLAINSYSTIPSTSSSSSTSSSASASTPAPYNPFAYVPTIASINNNPGSSSTRASASASASAANASKTHRRRRTGSKRSIDEVISSTTMHTNVSINATSLPTREGPTVSLLHPIGSSAFPMADHGLSGMFPFTNPHMQMGQIPGAPFGGFGPSVGPSLPLNVPVPPLSKATPINPAALQSDTTPRPKKKSKYNTEQDNIILRLKKEGKSWGEISDAAKCGNSLAARNRYQVLIGQQGGGAVVWEAGDAQSLKDLLEEGEKAKWNYVSAELSKVRNKTLTARACQKKIRSLFLANPANFGLSVTGPGTNQDGTTNTGPMMSGLPPPSILQSSPQNMGPHGSLPPPYQHYPYQNQGMMLPYGAPAPQESHGAGSSSSTATTPSNGVYIPYGMTTTTIPHNTMSSMSSNIGSNMGFGMAPTTPSVLEDSRR